MFETYHNIPLDDYIVPAPTATRMMATCQWVMDRLWNQVRSQNDPQTQEIQNDLYIHKNLHLVQTIHHC
jgi:hypothetical protein